MSSCIDHREFLAAIADGETELVPATTLEHVESCSECAREIRVHRLLSSRLRQTTDSQREDTPGRHRLPSVSTRLRLIAGGVAVAIVVVAAGAGWFVLSRPDPVQAAVNASSEPMQIQSNDPEQVGRWCLQASGRNLPVVELDGLLIEGARMDRVASTDIVTIVYIAPSGARVVVSWLEGQAPGGAGVEESSKSGHPMLIVHSSLGTAVILGSSSDAMWQAAVAIETAGA